jgi:hypothetical protein
MTSALLNGSFKVGQLNAVWSEDGGESVDDAGVAELESGGG